VADALQIKDEADAEITAVRQEWTNDINARYNRKVEITTRRQMAELEELQRTFDANIKLIQAGFENEVAIERRKAGVWIQRTLQKAIADPNLQIHKPGLRQQLTDELKKTLVQCLAEQHEESLLQLK
jgi:UDP-N-acetyl-D-mannosaminuronate dehydrogenase